MKKFFQKISQTIAGLVIVAAITLIASAFTEPSQAPPGGNVSAPLNTSATTQTKTGKLLFPWFEDSDQSGYYADPGGNSMFSRIYTTATDLSASFAGPVEANAGIKVDGYTAITDGDLWHNTYGNGGWYNGTYAGGWYMEDTTWVRSYNNKSVYTGGQVRGDAGLCIGTDCRTSWPSSSVESDPIFNQNIGTFVYLCPAQGSGQCATQCVSQLTTSGSCNASDFLPVVGCNSYSVSCAYVGKLLR